MPIRSSTRPAWLTTLVPVLILWLVLGVRLASLQGRNLWFDEAIEYDVSHRPLEQVIAANQLQTLDPPLYSLMLNVWMNIGTQDFVLQLLSVFISLAAVALLMRLARNLLSEAASWLTGLMSAVATRSVFFGIEVNQHALVFLMSVLVLLVLEWYLHRPGPGRLTAFAAVCGLALMTHYQLALYAAALTAIGTLRLLIHFHAKPRRELWIWCGALALVALWGAALFVFHALPQKANPHGNFSTVYTLSKSPVSVLIQFGVTQLGEIFRFLAWGNEIPGPAMPVIGLALIGSLCTWLRRRSPWLAAYLGLALALDFSISILGFSIFGGRYAWYAFPLMLLLLSAALTLAPAPRWQCAWSRGGGVLGLALAGWLMARLPFISHVPFAETEQLGEVVEYVEAQRQPDDVAYVYYGARQQFTRYAGADLKQISTIESWARGKPVEERAATVWQMAAHQPRVWLLMSHVTANEGRDLIDYLAVRCRLLDHLEPIGAAGYLFDCRSP